MIHLVGSFGYGTAQNRAYVVFNTNKLGSSYFFGLYEKQSFVCSKWMEGFLLQILRVKAIICQVVRQSFV